MTSRKMASPILYAQTITYGLAHCRDLADRRSGVQDGTFVLAEDIHTMVPITNPFLKEMLESFLKVGGRDTSQEPGLRTSMNLGFKRSFKCVNSSSEAILPAVLEDFGNRNPGEDPVIRFYEDFLKAYNKELKIKRGVFYTPGPVVCISFQRPRAAPNRVRSLARRPGLHRYLA